MAVPTGPVDLPDGHLTPESGPVAWIADNRAKGASRAPAITVQSTAGFAAAHLEQPRGVWAAVLADAAEGHLRIPLEIVASHRWRYSQPRSTWDIGALGVSGTPPVVLAGEAFAGARIEGAFLSGVAASDLISG
jgi:hypothetical protein